MGGLLEVSRLTRRATAVRELLLPLVTNPDDESVGYIQCQKARTASRRNFVLAGHSGVSPDVDYRDWRISTYRRDFRCRYYEIWEPADERFQTYKLYRAYLTLFRIPRRQPTEDDLIALHCDPTIDESEPHALYKRGPHLHMSFAGHPYSHAHLALNQGHLTDTLKDIESLSNALATSIGMLKEQILELDWSQEDSTKQVLP